MFTPRSNSLDLKRVSTDADYCIKKLRDIPEFDDEFERILVQLEKHCEPSVAERLFDYSDYLSFKLLEESNPKSEGLQNRLITFLANQNLPYEAVIRHLITEHRNMVIDKFCQKALMELLLKNAEFRKSFIEDEKYTPLFKRKFIDALSKVKGIEFDWGKINSLPVKQEIIDEAIEKVYGFNKPYSPEQESIIAAAKVLANSDIVLAQLEKAEEKLSELRTARKAAGKPIYDSAGKERHSDHKLLSGFLYDWAKDNGFGGVTKLLKEVSPEQMLGIFRQALMWKDKGLRGKYHGEFLHIWQWYILTEANKDKPFLSVEPDKLLKWIGGQPDGDVIWDKTFEGSGPGPGPLAIKQSLYRPDFDARNFNSLNEFLLGDKCKERFPVMSELMRQRLSKYRGVIREDTPAQEKTRYFNRK